MVRSKENYNLKKAIRQLTYSNELKLNYFIRNPKFKELVATRSSKWFRLFWIVIIASCVITCSYQISERLLHFYNYPTAVDISIMDGIDSIQQQIPDIKICSSENANLNAIFKKTTPLQADACYQPMYKLMTNLDEKRIKNFTKLWDYSHEPSIIKQIRTSPKSEKSNVLTYTDLTFLGQCSGLKFNKVLGSKIHNLNLIIDTGRLCPNPQVVINLKQKTNFTFGATIHKHDDQKFNIGYRQYNLIETPKKKCVNYDEYKECFENCIKTRLQEETSCRLPFYHTDIDLPPCDDNNAEKNYIHATNIDLKPNLKSEKCQCIRSCTNLFYIISSLFNKHETNITTLGIYIDDKVTHLTERRTYFIQNFFIDSGGTLGLFLGLSLLDFIEIFHLTIRFAMTKKIRPKKIHKKINIICEKRKEVRENKTMTSTNKMQIVTFLFCFAFAAVMIQQRFSYYLATPIRKIVELVEHDIIHYPPLTICGNGQEIEEIKINYTKKTKLPDWCDIDILDLMDPQDNSSLEKLWEKTLLEPLGADAIEAIKMITVMKVEEKEVMTHLGKCHRYEFSPTKYAGTLTLFPMVYFAANVEECRQSIYRVFIDDIDSDSYDILTESHAPVNANGQFGFFLSTINRINVRSKPCVDKVIAKDCKKKCLSQKLKEAKFCKLPFIIVEENLTTCDSIHAAKESRQKYIEIMIDIQNGRVCKCPNSCNENVLTFRAAFQPIQDAALFMYWFSMVNNVEEKIIEIKDYTMVPLFCDMGNSLGMALGLSVLTVVRQLHLTIGFVKSKLKK